LVFGAVNFTLKFVFYQLSSSTCLLIIQACQVWKTICTEL